MAVQITMRVKVHDFEGTRKSAVVFANNAKKTSCHWSKVYRSEKDPNDVLWLMERESHNAFNRSGDESGKEFNALVNPSGEWEDVVWHLSGVFSIE